MGFLFTDTESRVSHGKKVFMCVCVGELWQGVCACVCELDRQTEWSRDCVGVLIM